MLEANRLILETVERHVDGELVDSPGRRAAWSSSRARGSSARPSAAPR
jgi:hypothetical protein